MYIIIKNFNCVIRKNQIRLKLIFLNLILNIKKINNNIKFINNVKSKLYYKIIKHILKYELTLIILIIISLI